MKFIESEVWDICQSIFDQARVVDQELKGVKDGVTERLTPLMMQAQLFLEMRRDLDQLTRVDMLITQVLYALTQHDAARLEAELGDVAAICVAWMIRLRERPQANPEGDVQI